LRLIKGDFPAAKKNISGKRANKTPAGNILKGSPAGGGGIRPSRHKGRFAQKGIRRRNAMDHIDPSMIRGFVPPMTAEVTAEIKKKLKETKEEDKDEGDVDEAGDLVLFSESTLGLPEKKKEAFMADAKSEISELDRNSETFVDDATEKLVNSALKREYGPALLDNPGYKQMQAILKRRLVMDPRYRPIIEEFLGTLLESEEQ
jgi:hypothetical protein